VGGNPTGYIDPDGLIGRRASVTSPLQSLTNVNANLLIRSIQRIDPAFTFPVVTPVRPGQPINYSPSSVRQLQQFLRNAQTAGFCGLGASTGRFGSFSPNFVVSSSGNTFGVPTGAVGPRPVINNFGNTTGSAFVNGSGGANGQVTTLRIMNPNPVNPNGYVRYTNSNGQGVDPATGRTGSNRDTHIPLR